MTTTIRRSYPEVNPQLLGLARQVTLEKQAFVPGGDPMAAQMGGGGGDPAAGGGDPAAGMGAPPMDPSAGGGGGGGGGGADLSSVMPQIQQMIQQAMMQGGGAGGAGSGAGGLKPKIDVNVEIMQIKHMLAKICDALNIHIPVQDMVATPEKLNAMASGQNTQSGDPSGGAGGAGGGQQSAIQPIQPMQAAAPGMGKQSHDKYSDREGTAFSSRAVEDTMNKATAVAALLRRRVA